MMAVVRGLLVQGNDKLSKGVWHFDIPARKTCPGKSKLCSRHCYAARKRFLFPQVRDRLAYNYDQSKRSDFVDRAVDEIYRKGIILMRFHVAGDIYSPAYGRKLLEIIGRSPHCTFWLYTRSWRVKTIYPVLQAISALPNAFVWFSADEETGYPPEVPERVRVAWMQTDEDEEQQGDLVFLLPSLRKKRSIPLDLVCPAETELGEAKGTSCATCRVCWTG